MRWIRLTIPAALLLLTVPAWSDGFGVDKVYHPYVEAMEQELEYRVVGHDRIDDANPGGQSHMLGYGRAFGERWFVEVYLVGDKTDGESLELEAYEVEARYQITEQGEFWADWGLLLELEKERGEDIWEAAAGLLVEKETGRWSTTVNLSMISEWGDDIDDELETKLAIQSRFRYRPWFEPGVELHSAEDTSALGPLLQGDIRLGNRRNLHWEAGYFIGLGADTPDHSARAGLEFEF